MIARVGTLAVGTRFVTLLSGREARVLNRLPDESRLVVFGLDETKWLHPDVRVRVVEVTH